MLSRWLDAACEWYARRWSAAKERAEGRRPAEFPLFRAEKGYTPRPMPAGAEPPRGVTASGSAPRPDNHHENSTALIGLITMIHMQLAEATAEGQALAEEQAGVRWPYPDKQDDTPSERAERWEERRRADADAGRCPVCGKRDQTGVLCPDCRHARGGLTDSLRYYDGLRTTET